MRLRRRHAVALLLLGLVPAFSGCATRTATVATVQERSAPARQPESAWRAVRTGDTLYSIAWESGRDYRDIAAWNGIEPPYLIKPGDAIRLHPPSLPEAAPAAGAGYRIVAPGDTLYGIASAAGVRHQDIAAWNSLEPPYTIVPGQRLRLTPPPAAAPQAPPTSRARAAPPRSIEDDSTGPIAWRWPTEGTIVARFAPNDGAKGIDIAGVAGQDIRAAAGGTVVYRGSGLRGYGQLIILKHDADFLSAYAHCSAIYVQEGSVIQPGQKIAAMGSTGAERVKLHFEIRRRGVPVNPLEHLPKK